MRSDQIVPRNHNDPLSNTNILAFEKSASIFDYRIRGPSFRSWIETSTMTYAK